MKPIALITPSKLLFNAWLVEFTTFDKYKDYIMVNKIEHCRGFEFKDVILGHDSDLVDQDVIQIAKSRVR